MSWFDKLTIDCTCGDILTADSQVVACNTTVKLGLHYSLGKQLVHLFGDKLLEKVTAAKALLPSGELPLGQAIWVEMDHSDRFAAIIFFSWWSADNEFSNRLIYQCLASVLRTAFNNGCRSLAVPLYGSGSGSMDFKRFQETVCRVLVELNTLRNSDTFSVEELVFVSTDQMWIEQLESSLAKLSSHNF